MVRRPTKTVEEYRHNIKLLKYHLKKEEKLNETLRYKEAKRHKQQSTLKHPASSITPNSAYSLLETVRGLSSKLKEMGLVLGDVFRMADAHYAGEVTREQFMKCMLAIKAGLEEDKINKMFCNIDSDLNGMLSADEYAAFLCAYGGATSAEAHSFQRRSSEALGAALTKRKTNIQEWVQELLDPADASDVAGRLRDLGMSDNQTMSLLKMWDPNLTGSISHNPILSSMKDVKKKTEKQIQYDKVEKGVQELCVLFRDRKVNPMAIFEDADTDGEEGVSVLELENAFGRQFPDETGWQVKKWVNLININNDNQITREEYVTALRCFYTLQNINKFSTQYEQLHPKVKKALAEEDIPA